LLDTAIGEHTNKLSTTDSRDTTDTTQDWPLPRSHSITSKSPSKYTSRHFIGAAKRRQSRQRHSRTKNSYVVDSDTSTHARGPSIDSNRPRSSTDTDAGTYRQPPSELEHEPLIIEVPKQLQSSKSPIKHRAALFEKLSHNESAVLHEIPYNHDARNPIKIKGMWPPRHADKGNDNSRVDFIPSLQKHHMKFHHGREEVFAEGSTDSPPKSSLPHKPKATHVPPIPLTLSQLVSPRRQSRPDITSSDNSFTTAPQAKYNPVSVPPVRPAEERKTSYSWPLKWDFRKSPDASIKESSVVARAEPDHHTLAKKSYENQHRVHDLLVAAQEAVKEPIPEPESENHIKRRSTPPRRPMAGALAETPRTNSTTEKEVASQSSATPVSTVTPSTPRGRRRLEDLEGIAHSPKTEKDGAYKLEQRFTLSRSRSRGAGIRVQVDIRSPPASPQRDGDHTVVVTANVEPIREEEDAVGQPH
jgi:hypothetical protein